MRESFQRFEAEMRLLAGMFATLLICFAPNAFAADDFQERALAAVVQLGGKASVDEKLDEMARVSVTLEKADDKLVLQLAKMPAVGAITITDATRVTEAGYASLKELPDLQKLIVGKAVVTEKAAAAIGTLRTLDTLVLNDSKITDAGLASMKRLSNLKVLEILDSPLTDKSLPTILGYTKLEELNISGSKVTDAGVATLQDLTKLKLLRLHRTNVTRKGIDILEAARGKTLIVRW